MSQITFQKATRRKSRLRAAIDGPSGSGKTATALRWAQALARKEGGEIVVIDTERGSAALYHGECFDEDEGPLDFYHKDLTTFAPTEYTAQIERAGREGLAVIVLDSLTHAWDGKDGALDQVGKSTSKNNFAAWKDVTPQHRRMIDAILQSPCHVIATMRSKTETILEEQQSKDGRVIQVPRKIGMAPVQRAGMEYEFDVYGSMDQSHQLTISKTRCRAIDGAIAIKPGAEFLAPVIAWLEGGQQGAAPEIRVQRVDDATMQQIAEARTLLGINTDKWQKDLVKRFSVSEVADLSPEQAKELLTRLSKELEKKTKKPAAESPSVNGHGVAQAAEPPADEAQAEPPAAEAESTGKPQTIKDDTLRTLRATFKMMIENGASTKEKIRAAMVKNYRQENSALLTEEQAQELLAVCLTKLGDAGLDKAAAMQAENTESGNNPSTKGGEPAGATKTQPSEG